MAARGDLDVSAVGAALSRSVGFMDEGDSDQGRAGRPYGAGDEDRAEAVCALAERVVDGPGEGWTYDEPPELRRRQVCRTPCCGGAPA